MTTPSPRATRPRHIRCPKNQGRPTYQTLRRYIAQGKLPAVKVGGRIKVLRSDLNALAVPKRQPTFEEVEAAAERLASSAPPLSDAQVRRLSAIFGGAA
ncbi:helix-turn-helix domain-containing protein [Propionibacterium freudenreichii]|uniref:helix-turn-helix domain-containing protein n=1 Tax=Propionibacterium freudenreichii TaxID=1744 RepID=UPI0021A91AC7|nr:helix-turn-helix domain-containing protein [Propionibacterium freudenreichii]